MRGCGRPIPTLPLFTKSDMRLQGHTLMAAYTLLSSVMSEAAYAG